MSLLNECTFICKTCNKNYKSKQSLWNHNNKFHNIEHINITPNNSNITPNNSNITPNNSNITPNNSKSNFNNLSCKYCNKKFTRIDNLSRHINSRCSKKQETNLEDTIQKQTDELNQLKSVMFEQNTQLKSIISDLINKNCKVHPKTLQKINKQLNGDNN